MSQQTYRVVSRNSAGNWKELYEGTSRECRTFVYNISARKRRAMAPVITRRTMAGWLEKVNATTNTQ